MATIDDADFQRAYDIHGMFYDGAGEDVTEEDQKFYDGYVSHLFNLAMDDEVDRVGFGVRIWMIYAAKYVKEWNDTTEE